MMRYFLIPAAVLSLLLGLSLWSAATVEGAVTPWCADIEEAQRAAERDDWEGASRILHRTQSSWDDRRVFLHIVTAHDELETADALFATADSFAAERDKTEFRAALAELAAQLRVVEERQQLTLRNVL